MATDAAVNHEPLRRPAGRLSIWGTADWSPLVWTALALTGGVVLHADRVPLWVTAVAFALIVWRVAADARVTRLPGKISRAFLAFLLVGAVFMRFHTLNGLNPGTALLVMMAAVKLLETFTQRDQYIVLGGSLFLLLAACLDRQGLLRAPLYLLDTWLCCAAFASVAYSAEKISTSRTLGAKSPVGSDPAPAASSSAALSVTSVPVARFDNRAALAVAGRALLYAAPLAVLLFIFFPRIPGAFWSLPRADEARTGLSDTMSPGSISELTSSYDVAFRVKFDAAPPPPQQRYWRGPVLHEFDGYSWRRRPDTRYFPQQLEYIGPAYHYRVTLEPSEQKWWFSLDTVDQSPDPNVFFSYDFELVARNPVTDTTSYNATSHLVTRATQPLSKLARQVETQLPPGRNPRSLQLARAMRAKVGSDRNFVDAVLDFLRTGGFVYSLTPPLLSYDSVDDFLFNTRSGFCGHYASAFVTLMRGAGVPARVVTGYLGGDWNPIGSYFVVRQSDAHSWAEVWLEGRGWTRVDPTAVVEPDRLTRGLLDLMPHAGSAGTRLARSSLGLTELLQRWDAINTWWTNSVLKFDYRSQLNLLSRLGFTSPDLEALAWTFATALLIWLAWLAWQMSRGESQLRPDRLARAYGRLCRKLARVGLPRPAYQGPIAYAEAVGEKRPDLRETVRALLTRYADLRYGAPPADSHADSRTAAVAGFERAVARLSVPKAH